MTTRRKPIAKASIKNKKHAPKQNKTVKIHKPKTLKRTTARTGNIKKGAKDVFKKIRDYLSSLTTFQKKLIITAILIFLAHRVRLWPEAQWEQEAVSIFILSIFLFSRTSPLHDFIERRFGTTKLIMSFLIIFVIFPVGVFTSEKYKDWENVQAINSATRDIILLSQEIERVAATDLNHTIECSRTQEKFSSGKPYCKVSIHGYTSKEQKVLRVSSEVLGDYISEYGYISFTPAKGVSCMHQFLSRDDPQKHRFYTSCVVGLRDANISFALDEFEKMREVLGAE